MGPPICPSFEEVWIGPWSTLKKNDRSIQIYYCLKNIIGLRPKLGNTYYNITTTVMTPEHGSKVHWP
jgi:hypothetical protein